MNVLHVVYRTGSLAPDDDSWSAYSIDRGVYVVASSLDELKSEFRAALDFAWPDESFELHEHIEHPVGQHVPNTYIRAALDEHLDDRRAAANQMWSGLMMRDQRKDFLKRMPIAASGDRVVIACLPADHLGWIFEQMDEHDAVGLVIAGPEGPESFNGSVFWWSFVLGAAAERPDGVTTGSLGDAGLAGKSTVADLMRVSRTAGEGLQLATVQP